MSKAIWWLIVISGMRTGCADPLHARSEDEAGAPWR